MVDGTDTAGRRPGGGSPLVRISLAVIVLCGLVITWTATRAPEGNQYAARSAERVKPLVPARARRVFRFAEEDEPTTTRPRAKNWPGGDLPAHRGHKFDEAHIDVMVRRIIEARNHPRPHGLGEGQPDPFDNVPPEDLEDKVRQLIHRDGAVPDRTHPPAEV